MLQKISFDDKERIENLSMMTVDSESHRLSVQVEKGRGESRWKMRIDGVNIRGSRVAFPPFCQGRDSR